MKILLSNDDGIFAPGLVCLIDALKNDHILTVVAPDSEQSAVSHGLTIRRPLFVTEWSDYGIPAYAVSGTPADCVKLGLDHYLAEDKPDLVITGINNGANTGINVFYSGTVGGAMEASFMNIPAIAISVDSFQPLHYSTAAQVACDIVTHLKKSPPSGKYLWNINVPDLPYDNLKGLRLTEQSRCRYKDKYQHRLSPIGQSYFWLDGDKPDEQKDLNLDDCAVKNDWVSLTPLTGDFNASSATRKETDQWLRKVPLQVKSCS